MQLGPNDVASRSPCQPAAATGGCQRRSPTGGMAYGIFLKTCNPPWREPARLPCAIVTDAGSAACAAMLALAVQSRIAKLSHATTACRLLFAPVDEQAQDGAAMRRSPEQGFINQVFVRGQC